MIFRYDAIREAVETASKRNNYKISSSSGWSQGGFCVAFMVENQRGEIKCYRTWRDPQKAIESNLKRRYELINSNPGVAALAYFVKSHYVEDALVLKADDGSYEKLPILEMDWVSGVNLYDFLDKKWKWMSLVQRLEFIRKFYIMFYDMKQMGISHGDLSCRNIIVMDDGELRLVDYDSVHVPSMEKGQGFPQTTGGLAGFQHPGRIESDDMLYTSKNDDNFAQLVISISLWMAFFDPSVIEERYEEDNLLFFPGDLKSIADLHSVYSIAWTDYIVKYKDKYPHFDTLVGLLERSIQGRVNEVPSLLDYVKGDVIHSKERFAQLAEVYKMNVIPQSVSAPAVKMAKYCTYCGEEFETDADKFCDSCGKQREVCYS